MFCALCQKATLYIDGKLRCDLEYDQERADQARMCFGQIEGRFKMFEPDKMQEEERKMQTQKVRKTVKPKAALPKAVKPKKSRKSKIPAGQAKLF